MRRKTILFVVLILTFVGFVDALYLTYEHYNQSIPPCHPGILVDCGKVLGSKWSSVFGIPVAVFGVGFYSLEFITTALIIRKKTTIYRKILLTTSFFGFIASLYFMFIQLIVIGAICLYCTLSAVVSTIVFFLTWRYFGISRKYVTTAMLGLFYKSLLKKILFKINPELVHEIVVDFGMYLSKIGPLKIMLAYLLKIQNNVLEQKVADIIFENPIGLAAGFDYDAKLTQILSSISFGFMTVGTVTNKIYEGNPSPRLGRLPKSRSLMVNKGFKSVGVDNVIKKLKGLNFDIPVGISIGRTNSTILDTQKKSVEDIIAAFKKLEKADLLNVYYELNISCPNLIHAGNINFYETKELDRLLSSLDKLKIKKPIFVKMPIDKTDKETLDMLQVIKMHNIKGVIFGNLQKDRNHPSLDPNEVAKFEVGNFSGKPTWQRSNELISLTYRKFDTRFIIIGCGGVFSAEDAYEKIKRGASLVQLITGMIFEGPQLISRINLELADLVKRDGFNKVSEAIGSYNR